MKYQFPIINNIDDVLPHIKDYEEITVNDRGDYTVIKYMISTPHLWEWDDNDVLGCSIRRECRGIIFDSKTGKLLARPYSKFFNVNEKPETQLNMINLEEPHVILEKLDGSCVFSFNANGSMKLATKAGESEVSAQASNWLRNHDNYYDFMNYIIDRHKCTPIFEWCSRQNRIVIDYPEDRLILTAIRTNVNGNYISYDDLIYSAHKFGIDYVKATTSLSVQNINLLHNQVKEWEDAEGVVIRFDTGHMLKIKADDYILRHHAKESINHEKNLIGLILADGLDDLLPVLHENDQKRVSDFEKAFHSSIHDTAMNIHDMYGEYVRNYALSDKKDFAVNFALKKEKKYQQFLFGLHRGDYNLLDALYKTIENSISSSSRVENVRWIFGGIRF